MTHLIAFLTGVLLAWLGLLALERWVDQRERAFHTLPREWVG